MAKGMPWKDIFQKKIGRVGIVLIILPYLAVVSNKMQYNFQNIKSAVSFGHGTTTTIITTTP